MTIVEYHTPECPCEIRRVEFFSELAAEVFAQAVSAATCTAVRIVAPMQDVEHQDILQ